MSALARDIGYAGVCVLFDEAEAIVSFSRSSQRSEALTNLVRIVRQTEKSEGTYFVYAAYAVILRSSRRQRAASDPIIRMAWS